MRLVTGISIVLLAVSVALMVACAEKPNLTQDDVNQLIGYWSKDQLKDIYDDNKTEQYCLDTRAKYFHESIEGEPYYDYYKELDINIRWASDSTVDYTYNFRSNGMWLVTLKTVWVLPEIHQETILVDPNDGVWNTDLVNGTLVRQCMYRVNDYTGEVKPAGID